MRQEPLRAAIIGCGGRGRAHAEGYRASADARIVAVADPVPEAGQALSDKYDVPAVFQDHRAMLAEHRPEIVSVCTWTGLHRQIVLDVVEAGARAIHCEKPMAPTWTEAREVHNACRDAGVQLTFCHQRRFGAQFVKARELAQN